MPIKADCHLHSSYSGDSDAPMEDMIRKGISMGLETMCFTEHQDLNFPDSPEEPGSIFLLDADAYRNGLALLKEKYAGQIRLLFGVELGLQPEVLQQNAAFAKAHDFDFIIGSTHICHGRDPYYPAFYEGRSEEEAYREYFTAVLENLRLFSDFDVCGHLDYVVRYGPNRNRDYSYERYRDVIDEILALLLEKGKGLELNTGGLERGMGDFNPCMGVLRRYRELGGELITVGSDSHDEKELAAHFDLAAEALRACGFRYYTVYEKRVPQFLPL